MEDEFDDFMREAIEQNVDSEVNVIEEVIAVHFRQIAAGGIGWGLVSRKGQILHRIRVRQEFIVNVVGRTEVAEHVLDRGTKQNLTVPPSQLDA